MQIRGAMLLLLLGCAAGQPAGESATGTRTRTSVAYVSTRNGQTTGVVSITAGPVTVRHSVPSTARLRATLLEGLDDSNRQLRYEWDRDGDYRVDISGRYRHSVAGSIVGAGTQRISSTLVYVPWNGSAPISDRPQARPPCPDGDCVNGSTTFADPVRADVLHIEGR